jgi:hypothetical protein
MIKSNRKYPFGTIITLMRAGDVDFAISTAKEGVFKGLTTYVQIPVKNLAAKIFYMPSMNKQAIHLLHEKLVTFIEEQLSEGYSLVAIIDFALRMIKEDGFTLEIVTAEWFKDLVSQMQNKPDLEEFLKSSDKWIFIGSNDYIADYYDPGTVKIYKDEPYCITVTCKRVYTTKGKQMLFNHFEKNNLNKDATRDIHHSLNSYNIYYKEKTKQLLMLTYVSNSGEILEGGGSIMGCDYPPPRPEPIIPGTVDDLILKRLTKDYEINA